MDADHRVKHLIIDDGHHFSKLIPGSLKKLGQKTVNLTILLPDHGLTNRINKISKIFQPVLVPLLPDQIQKWWHINNMAQLKLRTKLIDPWAPGLIPDSSGENEYLFSRINHIIPVTIYPSSEGHSNFTFRDEVYCPTCQTMDTLDFMSLIFDKAMGKYLLKKKMVCKKRHQYSISYNFESGKIEYEIST